MSNIIIELKSYDGTQGGKVEVDTNWEVKTLVEGAIEKWALPKETAIEVFNQTKDPNTPLRLNASIGSQGVTAGDILLINAQGPGAAA
jgi:hypothetical protein